MNLVKIRVIPIHLDLLEGKRTSPVRPPMNCLTHLKPVATKSLQQAALRSVPSTCGHCRDQLILKGRRPGARVVPPLKLFQYDNLEISPNAQRYNSFIFYICSVQYVSWAFLGLYRSLNTSSVHEKRT